MNAFSNILVGVDLTRFNPLDASGLHPVAVEPVRWGIELAKANSARLLFFSSSEINEEALLPLSEADRAHVRDVVYQGGGKLLQKLVDQAREQGIAAESKIVPGKGWLEIIRQVLRFKHDLVIVGTRDVTSIHHILFGNTGMKLLRRCPCPVLVTRPQPSDAADDASAPRVPEPSASPLNILVATDMQPPAEQALRLGITLAHQMNAHLHVLHVVEYQLDEVCNIGLPDATQDAYRRQVRTHANQLLHAQLEKTDYKSLGSRIDIHLAGDVNVPDVAIKHFIESYNIHLLLMGTIGGGGIRGIMIGNTAERLLLGVRCSVLAVKPPDFVCPVDL
jgi:universal stress protein E